MTGDAASPAFLFRPGDRVRIRPDHPPGHIRTPCYLRGHAGVVHKPLGHFRNPEDLAYGKPGLPRCALYQVRFRQCDLWPGYGEGSPDTLIADIYEHWLEPLQTGETRDD